MSSIHQKLSELTRGSCDICWFYNELVYGTSLVIRCILLTGHEYSLSSRLRWMAKGKATVDSCCKWTQASSIGDRQELAQIKIWNHLIYGIFICPPLNKLIFFLYHTFPMFYRSSSPLHIFMVRLSAWTEGSGLKAWCSWVNLSHRQYFNSQEAFTTGLLNASWKWDSKSHVIPLIGRSAIQAVQSMVLLYMSFV